MFRWSVAATFLLATVCAQQACNLTEEKHPQLSWQKCQADGSCAAQTGSVVIDANWRWVHSVDDSTNCYTGNTWNTDLCPDDKTCAEKCCLDGAQYESTYGVSTSDDTLSVAFVTTSAHKNVGSRLYLMASDAEYEEFTLLGNELSFDVDVSALPCGLNGALYFVSMAKDGGMGEHAGNVAGAKYGTGYCDSQCPRDLKFIDGQANVAGWTPSSTDAASGIGSHGSCCSEMDIWEANSISQALTPHPCETVGQKMCTGDECGGASASDRYGGSCDPDGCDWNPYRLGNHTFYGPGSSYTIDTTKKFTVVTQFASHGDTLGAIKRFYVQDGVEYAQPGANNIDGYTGNDITAEYCKAEEAAFGTTPSFTEKGGLPQMAKALSKGMVLVMSLWDDHDADMLWLDSIYPSNRTADDSGAARGSCPSDSGVPSDVESQHADSKVMFSNIRFGPVGSTTLKGSSSGSGDGTGGGTAPGQTPTSTGSVAGGSPTQTQYGQCGGQGWSGPTQCPGGLSCQTQNAYYAQCL